MKIYLAHSSKFDYINELYKPIQKSDLHLNNEFIYFCEDPNYKQKSSKEVISESDLVLAEISETSTGMGIEIGWANMMNIPIIMIHKDSVKVSGYLGSIAKEIIEYSSTTDLLKKLADIINVKI